jgi:hypothetical protein
VGLGRVQAICDFSFIATSFLDANTMTGDEKMDDKHPKGTHNPSESSTQRWDNEGGAIKGVRAKGPRVPSQQSRKKMRSKRRRVEECVESAGCASS